MDYRRDIDGLRTIAVVPVVLFHAFPHWLRGGFVGVDIFFVISGYLITGLLIGDIDAQRFSLLGFYERRARRILPALMVVLAACVVGAAILYLPVDFRSFSASLLATSVFASNLQFWRMSGYFDGGLETQPLLHTWSLAVEEQFYLFFPPLLALLAYRWRRQLVPILLTLAAFSLIACIHITSKNPQFAFYMLPTRAWELLIGALLALGAVPYLQHQATQQTLSLIGLALILFSVIAYSQETAFPGAAALAPTLGAALIIYSGSQGSTWVAKALSHRLMVGVGLLSYSLYLWHWPLLAMLRYYAIEEPSAGLRILAVVASLVLAGLSWKYVENPVRRRQVWNTRSAVFGMAGMASALALAIGVLGFFSHGLPGRFPKEIAELGSTRSSKTLRSADREHCIGVSVADVAAGRLCEIGHRDAGSAPGFLLWGDSQAETFRGAIASLAENAGEWGYFAGRPGCPPLLDVQRTDANPVRGCLELNEAVVRFVREQNIKKVILGARWTLNLTGQPYQGEHGNGPVWTAPGAGSSNAAAVEHGIRRSIETLIAGGARIFLVSGVPEVGVDVPRAMALQQHFSRTLQIAPRLDTFMSRNAGSLHLLETIGSDYPAVTLLHPYKNLCSSVTGICRIELNGVPWYCDDDHLSLAGAQSIRKIFEPVFGTSP